MNNNCEFAGSKDCLCSACQSMREMIRELEERSKEELFSGFSERKVMEAGIETSRLEK